MKKNLALLLALALTLPVSALDTVIRSDGTAQTGRVIGGDASGLRLEISLGAGQATGTVTIRYPQIKEIVLADRETLLASLARVNKNNLPGLAQLWNQRRALLPVTGSLAGAIGLTYSRLLLESDIPAQKNLALTIYSEIEERDPDEILKGKAIEGRLQALIALGRAAEAVEDAKKLAESSADPSTLIQAKFILAEAAFSELLQLEKDNPRWTEDSLVRPLRNQLYNDALHLYLFATLFHGAEVEPAARSLWRAIEVAQLNQDIPQIRSLALDLQILYPGDPHAAKATALLTTLPKKIITNTDETNENEN